MMSDPYAPTAPDSVEAEVTSPDVSSSTEDVSSSEDVLVLEEAPDPDAVLPVWEPTGHPSVDAALEELHAVSGADLGDHAAIYERVQQSLRATLDGLAAEDESAS